MGASPDVFLSIAIGDGLVIGRRRQQLVAARTAP
jgi:hypothetical protein